MKMRVICGLAGTGKSTYLSSLIRKEKRTFVVLAATHSAVETIYNITKTVDRKKFMTLYSYFRIDYINKIVRGPPYYVEVIYIDEFSLLNKHLFKACLQKASKSEFVVCGDPLQLNAIYDADESITFKELKALQGMSALAIEHYHLGILGIDEPKTITVLKEIKRNDSDVKDIITSIFFDNTLDVKYDFVNFDDAVRLLLEDDECIMLASKYSILQRFYDDYSEVKYGNDIVVNQQKARGMSRLHLKEGIELLMTENTDAYYNGQLVYFVDYSTTGLYVKHNNDIIRVEKINGEYPITPSNFLTIHKSQGMTLKGIIICIDDLFDPFMLYTALTRAKSSVKFYTKQYGTYETKREVLLKAAHADVFNELRKKIYGDG